MTHPFWWLLSAGCIAWYVFITGYVAIRGGRDILEMLRAMAEARRDK